MASRRESPASSAPPSVIEVDGASIPLSVRRSPRARRLYLRIDPADANVELVLPRGVGLGEGLRFARERTRWIAARLASIPARTEFADGARIPVLGETLTVRHRPDRRGPTHRQADEIVVGGDRAHVARRVRDWLRGEARRELTARCATFAQRIGRRAGSIRIGDTTSRWGSCSPGGTIAFSWRLVLAPPAVMDYVVAHEVAHLIEHNHGPRFWALVAELCPDGDRARRWLQRHGNALLRYG